MAFQDHFSGHSATYAQARPMYPPALFEWLAAQCPRRELAWDAGCGNGQASAGLALYFREVFATDPSVAQIANAEPRLGVRYAVEPAERCSLPAHCADLVAVAQALHWFDAARFHAEARRVLAPNGVIAAWTYERCTVTPAVDAVFDRLYRGELADHWPPERRHVESGYATLPFPFAPIAAPTFELRCEWSLTRYLTYLRSWSASQRYLTATGRDVVGAVEDAMRHAWGDPEMLRTVRWPLSVLAGRV